jgi:hypothetical protein
MEINSEVIEILKEFKIDKSEGLLCLLGIYHNLDVEKVCSEETIKAINLTKIVDKAYSGNNSTIIWNIPLYKGEQAGAFDWVKDWIQPFGRLNPERIGSSRDATTRMQEFFKKYPEYRKDDVYKARDLYLSTVKDARYLFKSHKFIFDGVGAMKKSELLAWCEKAKSRSAPSNQVGRVIK